MADRVVECTFGDVTAGDVGDRMRNSSAACAAAKIRSGHRGSAADQVAVNAGPRRCHQPCRPSPGHGTGIVAFETQCHAPVGGETIGLDIVDRMAESGIEVAAGNDQLHLAVDARRRVNTGFKSPQSAREPVTAQMRISLSPSIEHELDISRLRTMAERPGAFGVPSVDLLQQFFYLGAGDRDCAPR